MTWAQRRQRGRERTARAVGILGLHARRGKAYFAVAGEEPVRTFRIIKMPALHQHRPAAHRQQRIALLFHFPFSLRVRRAQQRGGFRKIGRDERYLRQQLIAQRLDGGGGEQRIAAFCQHDGIQHHVLHLIALKPFGHRFYNVRFGQHADLGGINTHVAEHRIQLRGNKIWLDAVDRLHAARVLRHQRGNHRAAVRAQRREGFQVCLDTRAAAGIGAGNGQGVNPLHACSSSV